MKHQYSTEKMSKSLLPNGGKLAAKFRRMNTLIFAGAICIMALVMILLFNGIVATISAEYARQYALSSAEALSTQIKKEIDIVSMIARSNAVAEWLRDESDKEKMSLAVDEMMNVVSDLYSYNLYIGVQASLNEYSVGMDHTDGDILHIDILDINDPDDTWYFDSIKADSNYLIDIGFDRELGRKRVWIDYKVVYDGVQLGVISTGLEFSHVVGELFTHYSTDNMRGLIIDEQGVIHMDSSLMNDRDFLFGEFEARIDEEFSNTEFLRVIVSHLRGIEGYAEESGNPVVTKLSSGSYRNATLTPIKATNWSVVILSASASLFDISYFIPLLITVLVLLTTVALITSAANYRLIFLPLGELDRSLLTLRESTEGCVYGAERDDELGDLSKTIQDLFAKANIDALTGIYNRRFMENNLEQIIEMLSRANGLLSVLMIDIDYFKKYNDTYGHDQGDVCLKEVARAMSSGIKRKNDFTARYGGEEFVAILPSTDENGACVLAEKLICAVRKLNMPHLASTVEPFVTVSIGVTTGRVTYGQSWKEYIKRADEALYTSKQNGRNRFTFLEM